MARLVALLVVLLVAACAPAGAPSASPSALPSASSAPTESATPGPSATPEVTTEPSPTPSGGPQVPFEEVFLAVTARGGHCREGFTCETVTVIGRDGRISRLAPDPAELGTVRPDVLDALDLAIRSADFELIKSRPFTGECPTAFDGQELVYEFAAPSGVQKIASCEVGIDENDPFWLTVAAALAFGED